MRDSMRANANASSDSLHPPPVTLPGGPVTVASHDDDDGTPITRDELAADHMIDIESTGVSPHSDELESLARPRESEEEIVIADDMAEIVDEHGGPKKTQTDEEEEHNDAGAVPPFRTER
jgi:hypothetical protein